MKENLSLAILVSILSLIGIPLFFLVLSFVTGNWKFFFISLVPALAIGLTGIIITLQRKKHYQQRDTSKEF
ncbi:hypothetical protein PGH26_06940 [Sporosarcina jeotgali]|uniref:Uncharacterized protein n=1 Tax=Sporosarcina jeotgali TaxID=3020056 RepID=A0ABZ0KZI4_9BACL|nr:hypothetical protein [Sporosarcina sp. B2O-1]WOV85666.1 hypothetical protein PGH26_06940 [Sporosarcina sp. B2O-1]